MTPQSRPAAPPDDDARRDGEGLAPLPGEPGIPSVGERRRTRVSRKGLLAVALLAGSLIVVAAMSIQRYLGVGTEADDAGSRRVGDRPTAASMAQRTLEVPPPAPAPAAPPVPRRIPPIVPTAEEPAEPIGVRRSSAPSGAPDRGKPRQIPPQDAPVMLVTTRPGASRSGPAGSGPAGSGGAAPQDDIEDADDPLLATRRNLEAYQRQLQGLMETLTTGTQAATSASAPGRSPVGIPPSGASPAGGSRSGGPAAAGTPSGAVPAGPLLGGGLARSATPVAVAGALPDRSLTLPRGSAFTCALETRVVSAASGFVGCRVQRNVYGDDGRVLLIERGSHLDGEYRIASLRPGAVRIPVLWTRIRTPHGVTVDVDSPGTGALGESGIDGHVDNRWGERLGAAMLLSLIDDSVKLVIQNQADDRDGATIVLPGTTASTGKLAEKVLDSTIAIPPLIYRNQGGIVGIVVARDADFSRVYELAAGPR